MVSRLYNFSHKPKRQQLLALHLLSRSFLKCVPSMPQVPCLLAKGPGPGEGRGLRVGLLGPLKVTDWVLGGAQQLPCSEAQ